MNKDRALLGFGLVTWRVWNTGEMVHECGILVTDAKLYAYMYSGPSILYTRMPSSVVLRKVELISHSRVEKNESRGGVSHVGVLADALKEFGQIRRKVASGTSHACHRHSVDPG
jgi:hypothetical protein